MLSRNGRSGAASTAALTVLRRELEAAGHLTGPYQYHPRRRSLLSRT
jgi:hypothetical protein